MKLRATLTVEYDADPADYQTYDATEAAEIDQRNWRESPGVFFACFDSGQFKIDVEPVS